MTSLLAPSSMVILKIDPVESVAHLNNPELTTACQHLETKKYIAYAKERMFLQSLPDYRTFTFQLVFQGLRPNDEENPMKTENYISSLTMALQNTETRHDNLWTQDDRFHGMTVTSHLLSTTLDEGARVMMLLERFDTASYESAEMMGDNGHVDGSFIESSLSGIPHPENYQPSHHSYERGSHTPVNEDITLQGARSLLTLSFHGANLASQETPVLKVSFDISQVDQVNDPADYFKEISNLEKLKSEFEEKRKQREIERARQTDEAFIAKFSGETSR